MANEFKVKKGLIVDGTNTVLDIQGTQGQLFSVTDSLTGDLFSVSDISGVPILNVNSSGTVGVDGNLNLLGDNDKIQLGNSQDLQIYHDGTNSLFVDNGTGILKFYSNGNPRFQVGSDVHVLSGTDFAIAAGRKLYFDGQVHTYISEESDSNLKFYVGGSEMVNFTNDKLYFNSELKLTGNVTGTSTGCAALGRNHAYNTLELKGYGAELMIGSQSVNLHINYRTCNSGTSSHTPTTWYWRAGSATSFSDHNFGDVTSDGLVTWSGGNSSHLGTGAAVTTYVGNSTVNNAAIRSNSNTEDMWIMNWGDSAAWGIYNRNIDSDLAVTNAITVPANSTAFIGAGLARTYINHTQGNIGTLGTVEGSKLKILGSAGYFFNDSGTRTAFAGGEFYIQDSVATYYNYATNQYHGASSGDNHYFRSNQLVGTNWSIDTSGNLTALKTVGTDLTFGSTGGNGAGRLIIKNDTSGNQGTAGLGVLKQRDVNRQVVAGQNTHTGGYIWYTIKIPSGYSNSGLGSDVEVVIRTGGKHHNGKTLQKYIISVGNGTTASIGNFNDINILQTLDSRIGGSYGGSATEAEFYYRTSVANDTGEVILRLYRADREPVTVVEINPQGAWNETDSKTPSLVCHGLGTTFDSSTSKGQINQTRPTANLSSPIVLQKAGFTQTTTSNGKLDVSANGPASGASHEIARFVNLGSLANSSYMYIGASSGTDWRLGKNINGTAGNTNFGIATHSGTTLALEIDGSNNATFANEITSKSGVLNLDDNGDADGVINAKASLTINIDSDNNATGEAFRINRNTTAVNSTPLLQISESMVTRFTAQQNSGSRIELYNNRQDAGNVEVFRIASYNSGETSGIHFYRGGGGNSGYATVYVKKNNTASLERVVKFGGDNTLDATFAADVIAYSDKRVKENIKTLDGKKVLEMRGVSFNRIDQDGRLSSGVIAQELEKVAPELVKDDGDLKAVAYGNLTGYLIEAIKDQQKQIDELKKLIKNGNNL